MGALERRLRALERRVGGGKEFRDGAPPVDEHEMPDWTGDGLSLDAYERLLDCSTPDEELSEPERETRQRLAPHMQVFAQLQRDASGGEDVT